ncbi:vWA domain-containing protein [Schlesneria sp. T3-172]|uniref:vWA domain-containing protein n=1 Tax=Schlesneria sphaerica TaxID=3373610 RepID=UPI0037C900EF
MSTNASQPEVFEMQVESTRIPRSLLLACLISLVLHVAFLGTLGLIKFAQKVDLMSTITTVMDQEDDDPLQHKFDTAMSDQVGNEGDTNTFSASQEASTVLSKDAQVEIEKTVDSNFTVATPVVDELPQPAKSDVLAAVATSGATEHVGGVEGAIDRLSWEIANSLREKKTLVVWLFDVSPSLSGRRAQIADRVENVYKQLTQLDVGADTALRSAVAIFDEKCTIVTEKPVDDPAELVKVVRKIKSETNSSGIENTFSAVNQVANRYKSQSDKHNRVMLIVVTDEAGSDSAQLEQAIANCSKYQMRCYCVGDSAPFGRETVETQFELETGEMVIGVMQKGPESFFPELVRLGFWGANSYDLDDMSSGFGPYGLTRLCAETNGLYFIADNGRGQHRFDPAVMRNYAPDYRPIPMLEQDLRKNKAKSSLVEACAAVVSETQRRKVLSISMPRLDFKSDNDTVLRQELTEAQKPIADLDLSLDTLLRVLEQGEKDRAKIKEARWKASYDLAMGRTLALRVRAFGYNTMLAEMKSNPKRFETPGSNKWNLVPSKEITSGAATKKMAAKANEYLSQVIDDHPGTPWALLAEREKSVPMGWEWKESHYDPNPVMTAGNQKAGPKFIEVTDPVTKKKTKKEAPPEPVRRDI